MALSETQSLWGITLSLLTALVTALGFMIKRALTAIDKKLDGKVERKDCITQLAFCAQKKLIEDKYIKDKELIDAEQRKESRDKCKDLLKHKHSSTGEVILP